VIKMASNVTWPNNETAEGRCNVSRCGVDVVDDQRSIIRVITLPTYLAAFCFGLVGNTLVIYVIARFVQLDHPHSEATTAVVTTAIRLRFDGRSTGVLSLSRRCVTASSRRREEPQGSV